MPGGISGAVPHPPGPCASGNTIAASCFTECFNCCSLLASRSPAQRGPDFPSSPPGCQGVIDGFRESLTQAALFCSESSFPQPGAGARCLTVGAGGWSWAPLARLELFRLHLVPWKCPDMWFAPMDKGIVGSTPCRAALYAASSCAMWCHAAPICAMLCHTTSPCRAVPHRAHLPSP